MPWMGRPWAGIVRVSHVGGRGGESFHADRDQVADLEREVQRMGGELVVLPAELDVSGGLPLEQRPSLLAAVEGVERGIYAGIIVAYLSRLGRSVREQLRAWDRVEAAGGRIVVVREGIDTSTAAGRFQRTVLLAVAEQEREQHTERFEERRQRATHAGIWQARQTPAGYRRDPATRRLVPDDRADDVRAAFASRAAGEPMVRIAERLGMTPSGARQLLANRVYLGELKVGRHVNPDAHPPLVDVALFELAGAVRASAPTRKEGRERALLAGLARCCGCGHVMSRTFAAAETYVCVGAHSAGRCPEPAAITRRIVDELVERVAVNQLGKLAAVAVTDDGPLAAARRAVQTHERELARFLEGVEAASIDPADWARAAGARRERLDEARAALGRLESRNRVPVVPVGDLLGLWEASGATDRNTLLRGLVEAVLIRRGGGRGSRTLVENRVRVIAAGSGYIVARKRGGVAHPIERVVLPPPDHPAVLRVPGGE